MAHTVPTPALRVAGKPKWRIFVALGALVALLGLGGLVAGKRYGRTRAEERREAEAVATIRSLGGRIEDQLVEELIPLGRLLPGAGTAHFRFAISLRNPRVTDADLAVLDQFAADRVASLDVLNCKAGDATLARAARFTKLTLLALGQARTSARAPWPTGPTGLLADSGFRVLDRLPELRTVGLHGPDVTDLALAHLAGARKLRVLILHGSRVTGAGLIALGPKPELTTLKLGGTSFGNDDLSALKHFASLEELDLRDTRVTDAGLSRLADLPHLKQLTLAGCVVSQAAVEALIRQRSSLVVDYAPAPNASR